MKIREAEVGDEAEIIRLCESIIEAEGIDDEVLLTSEQYSSFLELDYDQRPFRCLIAEEQGVIGMAMWQEIFSFEQGPAMYVIAFAVSEKARHKGVGTRLFDELKKIARDSGYPEMQLFVHKDNASARDFYKSNGAAIYEEWDFAEIPLHQS